MSRSRISAIVVSAFLACLPGLAGAQREPITPTTPKIVLTADLSGRIDNATRVVFTRLSMTIADDGSTAFRAIVPMSLCAGLAAGQSRNVAVPPLRWGVANGVVNGGGMNATIAPVATPFVVSLSYTTVVNGQTAERRVSETVTSINAGAERLFTFTDPARATTYTVSLFTEPARSTNPPAGPGTKANREPVRLRTFCVPSVDAIDRAIVVSADAAAQITDANRSNNVLRLQ